MRGGKLAGLARLGLSSRQLSYARRHLRPSARSQNQENADLASAETVLAKAMKWLRRWISKSQCRLEALQRHLLFAFHQRGSQRGACISGRLTWRRWWRVLWQLVHRGGYIPLLSVRVVTAVITRGTSSSEGSSSGFPSRLRTTGIADDPLVDVMSGLGGRRPTAICQHTIMPIVSFSMQIIRPAPDIDARPVEVRFPVARSLSWTTSRPSGNPCHGKLCAHRQITLLATGAPAG